MSQLDPNFERIKNALSGLSPEEGLKWLGENVGKEAVRFSSAFGEEDQVIAHMIASKNIPITIFTLDTGRLFQETYDVMDLTRSKYKLDINVFFPEAGDVEQLVKTKGPNSFFASVENRKECCFIRKVKPLRRALKGAAVWVTGLRASQSANRQSFELVEWDADHQVIKYNPLLSWSYEQMTAYLAANKVPVNSLHKKGFASIGCAPCTRAIAPGEDLRAGRWWWEDSHKECGLHETNPIKAIESK